MKNFKMASIALLLILAACMSTLPPTLPPTSDELNHAYYGAFPTDYQTIVQNFMAESLFDPYTAVYSNWKGPTAGWYGRNEKERVFGFKVCVDINAKNRMGGYVGKQQQYFMIRDNLIRLKADGYSASVLCDF